MHSRAATSLCTHSSPTRPGGRAGGSSCERYLQPESPCIPNGRRGGDARAGRPHCVGSGGGNGTAGPTSTGAVSRSSSSTRVQEGGKFVLFSGHEDDLKVLAAQFYQQYPGIQISISNARGLRLEARGRGECRRPHHRHHRHRAEHDPSAAQLNLLSEYSPPACLDSRLRNPVHRRTSSRTKPPRSSASRPSRLESSSRSRPRRAASRRARI